MNIKNITSIKDPLVVLARELTTSSGRAQHKKFLLFGEEQIQWAMQAQLTIDAIFCITCPSFLSRTSAPVFEVSDGILKKITDTNYLVPLVGIANYPAMHDHAHQEFVIVLNDLVDFGNIGTIVRTAQSFFINTFIFSNNGDPFQRKVIDSSRGLVFQSNFENYNNSEETIHNLKKLGYQIVVTSPHAPSLQSQTPLIQDRPIALVVGNETNGVDPIFMQHADISIQIPMSSHVESLNVGVATGISIYELKFKQVLMMLKEKIFTNFGRHINVAGKLMQLAFDKKIRPVTNLSGSQVILLMIMHCDESMMLDQIARDVGVFGDELTQFLAPLFEKKLINSTNDTFTLTNAGKQFLAEIWPVVEQTEQKIFQDFTPQEKEQFSKFLDRVQASCMNIIK